MSSLDSTFLHRALQAIAMFGTISGSSVKAPWHAPRQTHDLRSPFPSKKPLSTVAASANGTRLDRRYAKTFSAGTNASLSPRKMVQGTLTWSRKSTIQVHGNARCIVQLTIISVRTIKAIDPGSGR
jgi:hypothetical protein